MPRIYRVLGTDIHGELVEVSKPNAASAHRAVDDSNRTAAKRGAPLDWRAEYADIEWLPLTEVGVPESPSVLAAVRALADRWSRATVTGVITGEEQPDLVTRGFAEQLYAVLPKEER
jgi:hypothetical protein